MPDSAGPRREGLRACEHATRRYLELPPHTPVEISHLKVGGDYGARKVGNFLYLGLTVHCVVEHLADQLCRVCEMAPPAHGKSLAFDLACGNRVCERGHQVGAACTGAEVQRPVRGLPGGAPGEGAVPRVSP